MAKTFDRRAVRTYHFDEMKWAVVRYFDGQLSGVLKGTEVEDEETGLTLQEGYMQEGDYCMAKWLDKKMYKAKILFIGSDKEEAAKQATLLKVAYPDRKQEKKADSDKEVEPKKRKLANPNKATEPTKKAPKISETEKKAQIRAHEKMVEELLAVQYGHGDQVEELRRSLEEKDVMIKEKEQIIKEKEQVIKDKEQLLKDKEEELVATKANLARLQARTLQPCPCNGALASSLMSESVQRFINQLAGLCPVNPATETLPQPSPSPSIPQTPAFSPPLQSRLMSPPAPPPPSPSLSPVSPRTNTLPSPSRCDADLVDLGGGVMLKKIVLDACISSAKGSTSKLVRNLLHAFFSDQELGESSAEGKGAKAALPTKTVAAIKGFVLSKSPKTTERELVQIMNCQCADSRKKMKNRVITTDL